MECGLSVVPRCTCRGRPAGELFTALVFASAGLQGKERAVMAPGGGGGRPGCGPGPTIPSQPLLEYPLSLLLARWDRGPRELDVGGIDSAPSPSLASTDPGSQLRAPPHRNY